MGVPLSPRGPPSRVPEGRDRPTSSSLQTRPSLAQRITVRSLRADVLAARPAVASVAVLLAVVGAGLEPRVLVGALAVLLVGLTVFETTRSKRSERVKDAAVGTNRGRVIQIEDGADKRTSESRYRRIEEVSAS